MKKTLYTLIILSSITVLGGCTKEEYYECNSDSNQSGNGSGSGAFSSNDYSVYKPDSVGKATKPADWAIISSIDPTSLMLVTINASNMPATINSNDVLSAFIGNECRGVVAPRVDIDGVTRFSMVVNQCADEDCKEGQNVELRYYSENKKRIFISDTFTYQPGKLLGSASESFVIDWIK